MSTPSVGPAGGSPALAATTLPSTGPSTGTSTGTSTTKDETGLGPQAFMKLLVAQLKYQNPMAPADGQAYMTQMATFAQVEKLDALVTAQAQALAWQQRLSAEGLVGRQVSGQQDDGRAVTGTVTGVRYTNGAPLLEVTGGQTLAPGAVERVAAAPPSAPTVSPGTTSAGTPAGTAPTGPLTGSTTSSTISTAST